MTTPLTTVLLPFYPGFTQFSLWPASTTISSSYILLSTKPFTSEVIARGTFELPYYQGCQYVAYPALDSKEEISSNLHGSKPEKLANHIFEFDVIDKTWNMLWYRDYCGWMYRNVSFPRYFGAGVEKENDHPSRKDDIDVTFTRHSGTGVKKENDPQSKDNGVSFARDSGVDKENNHQSKEDDLYNYNRKIRRLVGKSHPDSKQVNDWTRSALENGGFPKDQNILPYPGDPSCIAVLVHFENEKEKFYINENLPIKELRKFFCRKRKLKLSSVRFLLDGSRLDDGKTAKNLELQTGCVIDAFTELEGGGWKPKRNIYKTEEEILKSLDESDDDLESKSNNEDSLEEEEKEEEVTENINLSTKLDTGKGFKVIRNNEEVLDNVLNKKLAKDGYVESTQTTLKEKSEAEKRLEWLEDLRKNGNFSIKKPIDRKILYFLEQPKLVDVEVNILMSHLEMKAKHDEWEKDVEQFIPKVLNTTRKRKQKKLVTKVHRNLRRKINKDFANMGSEDEFQQEENLEMNYTEIDLQANTLYPETSKQRKHLLTRFELSSPSPLKKYAKATKEEMKQFSVAVHLWADRKCDGVKFLQEVRLTDKHFRDIVEFAGPNSKWNLLKARSTIQYKSMWRNLMKGKHYYRGHPETGYETESELHDPASKYCPFQHCSPGIMSPFDLDLKELTPQKNSSNFNETESTKIQRRLFTPEKQSKEYEKLGLDIHHIFEEPGPKTPNIQTNTTEVIREHKEQSPTKEELQIQNKILLKEIELMKINAGQNINSLGEREKERSKPEYSFLFKCELHECRKTFTTIFGLNNHKKHAHGENDNRYNIVHQCPYCGINVIFIDQHINHMHNELKENRKCEICQEIITTNMKRHRGACNTCPFCQHKETKKLRLIKHINLCKNKKNKLEILQEPLDLSSPKKDLSEDTTKLDMNDILTRKPETDIEDNNDTSQDLVIINDKSSTVNKENQENMEKRQEKSQTVNVHHEPILDSNQNYINHCWKQKRSKYPFDEPDESYISEFDGNDDQDYTMNRRLVKDKLELQLRYIDTLEDSEKDGDDELLNQFKLFQIKKRKRQVSTIEMYTGAIKQHILPAFHRLFHPFNALWILDCTTVKDCTFEGQKRSFVEPEEPIYMTSRIVEEAKKDIDSYGGQSGSQRGILLAATLDFLEFIEMHFNQRLNVYGPVPLERLIPYHNGVRTFLKATGSWKASNDEKAKAHQNKKVMETYENPNKHIEILEKYKSYLKSSDRLNNFTKILSFASEDAPLPSSGEMTDFGRIVMGEIVLSTGCRPVVVRRLTVGAFGDKTPGFNPRRVSEDDCIVEEETDDMKLYRRVNPNLPPKDRACVHQLEEKTAECSVHCQERCDPDGFNVFVTWDKLQNSRGSSYLHITKPLKVMMDTYNMTRSKFFANRKPTPIAKDDWLDDDNTPFFLNSACSQFKFLDLKHISDEMGCDVTAYSFRRIVCTWALCHEDADIREAEEEALQHGIKVARDRYQQNKQIKPQRLTQKYIEEENIFPVAILDEIQKTEAISKIKVKETEQARATKRYHNLTTDREAYKKKLQDNRPLGPKHRVQGTDRDRFKELVEDLQNKSIESLLTEMKLSEWRKYIVRLVCTSNGTNGNELREIWEKIYKGDLRWGVRDARLKHRNNNKKNTHGQDRNSWIAASIRKSLLTEKKVDEKKTYLELI